MPKLELHWQILIAIILAAIVGGIVFNNFEATGVEPTLFGVRYLAIFDYIGTIFLNALKMIIVPLITSSIIVGVAGIGSGGNLGALGGKTLLFYASTTLAAILVGLVLVNAIGPGYVDGEPAKDLLALDASTAEFEERVAGTGLGDVAKIFQRMVPPNIFAAAVEGQMLGIIFFAILFGYFMTHLEDEYAGPLYRFWDSVFHVMMRMTEWIMKFAPIGVFGLVAAVIAKAGYKATGPLATFAVVVLLALAVHAFVTLPLLLRFVGNVKPYATIKACAQPMLTAFSTASSSATLPVTMDAVEDNVGVSNKVSSFVLPLGATVNMNGTALYECAAAIFIAQAYGFELTFAMQFSIVSIALLTSIGVAGVPSASLVAIAIILSAVGLPLEALGVLLVFDRLLDMARTSVNVWGDCSCATIVARLSGEQTNVAINPEPDGRG
ncbi:MAG: dicarboxylate/amino acid:cation symporter [Gammaproteobacteria bacterium]|jgi:Na+/H+-dicarboxylate symporter|nr:dicarboxylate/amino acid:cation symporter [Gammaproteobacteria bacterium]MDH3848120.1 dicarboxylate/amino acid:cation symporter [Gammaproteobacteria bacterium]MDH3865132.1 dicarboxylate/amino acid:cation symporter [Gammaproteobacteria bacterium]MDH3906126.1 dicarboxylate/amino acid:cation symporter [Gammaproteobacteria bacterium]MDH3908373.1 dicarboxylate/amino acid:cation symporter [Gammaproteobacteria bacterium]